MKRMGILGKKIGMTQVFTEEGLRVPVTVIEVSPNVVMQVKTLKTHGYNAVQLGYGDQKPHRLNKPELGVFTKHEMTPKKFIRELRLDKSEIPDYKIGDLIKAEDILKAGDPVDVTGTSKGKGFQGVMKRWNFSGAQTETHGTHEYFRHAGSIGNRLTPGRVVKGRKMCGQMGNKKVTIQNLKIMRIETVMVRDEEKHLVLIQGGVPGPTNGYVSVVFAAKKRLYL
ncbi:50S ribosomal protein L3 [Myxococcota bacterium]|nr:50S ribosomal protein L3 [Myxococcota bacterium]